jgi:manganese/zinc/iron transport system permease protein
MLLEALTLGLGYNASLVTVGAALLGIAAGATGTFLVLRRRALLSDAIGHATLPGVALAFMAAVALGGDGRSLPLLLAGAGLSAGLGLLAVHWITTRTRLGEDAAIGAVLSVFFGFGVVLMTVIQTMATGRQAGLEGFLLGATAGMLHAEALMIAAGGAASLALVLLLRRPMTMVAFDPGFAASTGIDLRRIDLATMGLALAVTLVGLKVVGLVMIVALLIVPAAAARFWTDRSDVMVLIAGALGGLAGYGGAAISAAWQALPTGPVIVLVAAALFALSLVLAPQRGVLAGAVGAWRYRRRVHLRQGLLALAQGIPVYERYTLRLLRAEGLVRPDGVPTEAGRAQAARAQRDEARWALARRTHAHEAAAALYDGLRPIESVLTPDQVADLDARLGPPRGVAS